MDAADELGLAHLEMAMEEVPGLRFLGLDLRQLDEFAGLGVLRDRFDRLIVGAARALDAKLVSKDREIADLGLVRTVWP